MDFIPDNPNDNNQGQRLIWNALKSAFAHDEGLAFYRFPIFANSSAHWREPDFVLVHRELGVWILESKGCRIGDIESIAGHAWTMADSWYQRQMFPVSQAMEQLYRVKDLVRRVPAISGLEVPLHFRVVLPFISAEHWAQAGHATNPATQSIVWLKDDLSPSALRANMGGALNRMKGFEDENNWKSLLSAFGGGTSLANQNGSVDRVGARFRVEKRMPLLDDKQDRIALEIPEGPQRIRGLAGSGKTVLFARRVALMHAKNPAWDIAFVHWSRSLNQQITNLVAEHFEMLTGALPNWDKLHIWHAWGTHDKTGFYRELTLRWGCTFLNIVSVEEHLLPEEGKFDAVCRILNEESRDSPALFDAVVVDEGQDLPGVFYQVAYRALREPKRLYWAYDEAQGVDTLMVPDAATIFGRDEDGRPKVDLSGSYPSGVQKAHNMNRCYRTPRQILVAAHALNMGLLRQEGPVQGVSTKDDWIALGYKVVEGDFSPSSVKAGAFVTIERPNETSGHPLDDLAVEVPPQSGLLTVHVEDDDISTATFVVNSIERDIEAGLRPEDIAVVCLERSKKLLDIVEDQLITRGIGVLRLRNSNKDLFREQRSVTLSCIRRAKGNEAYKVYALNLHLAGASQVNNIDDELMKRNHVLVALTRTKLWCVAIGRQGEIMQELGLAAEQNGILRFRAFNQASLRRSMVDSDCGQQGLL